MDDARLPPIFTAAGEDGGRFVFREVTDGDGVPSKHLNISLVDEDSIDNSCLNIECGCDGFQESILVLSSVVEVQSDVCVDAAAM